MAEHNGTDQNSIFARLNSIYGNLNGPSSKAVKIRQSAPKPPGQKKNIFQTKNNVDENNNLENIKPDVQPKNRIVKTCICERPAKPLECGRCHQYFLGRIATICEKHPAEAFLMDFRECPYCTARHDKIKESELTWAEIRKIEDAVLPNDDL